ncbi:MAG: SLC13 family permease [Thermoprotei archaeon]|nr:SLC13 family permease [TACK group archaeon]
MTPAGWLVVATLVLVVLLSSRVRYDLLGMGALIALVAARIITPSQALAGFSSSAVIVIASALVLGHALVNTGIFSRFEGLLSASRQPFLSMMLLVLGAFLTSAFVSDVATVALFMPIVLRVSKKMNSSPSKFLIPLSFASILAGRLTLIGSSVNLVVAQFAYQATGKYMGIFEITPLGILLSAAGLSVIALAWLLLPDNVMPSEAGVEAYVTEARINQEFPKLGSRLIEAGKLIPARVLALYRDGTGISGFRALWEPLREGDVLVVSVTPERISSLARAKGLELIPKVQDMPSGTLTEAVVGAGSPLVGKTAASLDLWRAYGISLIGVSRPGVYRPCRLSKFQLQQGDVLLFSGTSATAMHDLGLLPLVERGYSITKRRDVLITVAGFAFAIAASGLNLLPISVAFLGGVLLVVGGGALNPKAAYASVEWDVVVMIGSFFSLAQAMVATGVASQLASSVFVGPFSGFMLALLLLYAITAVLANVINYVAAAMIMSPIALSLASTAGLSPMPYLVVVMMAASSTFMTPFSHGANLMVAAPGGYSFADYLKSGLPMVLLLMLLTVALVPIFFPA